MPGKKVIIIIVDAAFQEGEYKVAGPTLLVCPILRPPNKLWCEGVNQMKCPQALSRTPVLVSYLKLLQSPECE